jgi:hypothetical protein
MRRLGSFGAAAAAFVLVASGCQVITGSYTVSSLGPVCTSLASCCPSLQANDETTCTQAVATENEEECGAVQDVLPANACSPSVKGKDAGRDAGGGGIIILLPDAHAPHDGGGIIILPPLDASKPHDATSSQDVVIHDEVTTTNHDSGQGGGHDAGHDSGSGGPPPDLSGPWTLGGATCNGAQLGLDVGSTTTLTFETGSAQEVETLSDGCVITENIAPDSISDTQITSTAGSVECSSACTSADGCTAGSTGAIDLPFTLSGGTLAISETVDTSECSSGSILFNFQMD